MRGVSEREEDGEGKEGEGKEGEGGERNEWLLPAHSWQRVTVRFSQYCGKCRVKERVRVRVCVRVCVCVCVCVCV